MTDTELPKSEAHRRTPTQDATEIDVAAVSDVVDNVIANVETVIVGHHDAIEHILTALLGRGHVLLEDVPGVGKTMLARASRPPSMARSSGSSLRRTCCPPT